MAEPTTTNKALIIPNTGDLPGTWGSAAINPDMAAIDGMFGGVQTVSLSSSNVTLTVPAGFTATPSAGPTQSQNAVIRFTGTLSNSVSVFFPMPGFYIVENLTGNQNLFVVRIAATGGGQFICAPPGEACHVYIDGTNAKYVNLGRIGSYMDLATTAAPNWITGCSVPPYLPCDGSVFSGATYPYLAAYLGGTTTPDLRGRVRGYLNQGTGRITAGFGVNGDQLASAGGSQAYQIQQANLPAVNFNVDIPAGQGSHAHSYTTNSGTTQFPISGGPTAMINPFTTTTGFSTLPAMSGTAFSGGSGSFFGVLPPMTIGGITLIRAA